MVGWLIEGHDHFGEWVGWLEGYTVNHGYWQPLSMRTPIRALTGFGHAFVGGHFVFRLPGVSESFQQSFNDHGLQDEIFLAARLSPGLALSLAVLTMIVAIVLLLQVIRFVRKYPAISAGHGRTVRPILLCITIYSVFFLFWMPEILEFWILQSVLVWVLLVGTLPVTRQFSFPLWRLAWPMAGMFFLINFFGSILWLQRIENDWYFSRVKILQPLAVKGDLIYCGEGWILKDFLRRYTPARVIAPDDPEFNDRTADSLVAVTLAAKKKVYVFPSAGSEAGGSHDLAKSLSRFAVRTRPVGAGTDSVFVIE